MVLLMVLLLAGYNVGQRLCDSNIIFAMW
jgi:hypothetical protein